MCSSQQNPVTKHSLRKEGEKLSRHCLNLSEFARNMSFSDPAKVSYRNPCYEFMLINLAKSQLCNLLEAGVSVVLWPDDLLANKSLENKKLSCCEAVNNMDIWSPKLPAGASSFSKIGKLEFCSLSPLLPALQPPCNRRLF